MSYDCIDEWVREEHDHLPTVGDQLITSYWFYRNEITVQADEKCRTSEVDDAIGERLDHEGIHDVLDHLADLGVLEKYSPPQRTMISHERKGNMFPSPNHEDFPPELHEEISRLLYDLHLREGDGESGLFPGSLHLPSIAPVTDGGVVPSNSGEIQGRSFREFLAAELEVDPSFIEETLVAPDDIGDRMNQFDSLVEAIKESDEFERGLDYDQIGWRGRADKWALSEYAQRIEVNESLPGT